MPKPPKFEVRNTNRGWKVNVPASLSETGKKQEIYFPSRDKAATKATKLREEFIKHGRKVSELPPRVQDDAAHAWALLEPHGVSLTEAAREVVARIERDAASLPVKEALDRYFADKGEADADGLRGKTLRSYKDTSRKILAAFDGRIMSSIGSEEIAAAIRGGSYDLHRRNARAFWRWCAKPPRRWCRLDLFTEIEAAKGNSDADIGVLSPELVERLLRAAEKHYPETVCMFAVAFFGGLRMEELSKLEADMFDEDGITVGAAIAKKRRRRHVPLSEALKAWLAVYPFSHAPNWKEKFKAVRAMAGWAVRSEILAEHPTPTLGKWPVNSIRHTHASAEIANGATLEDLLFRFGHTDGPDVLRSHYVGRYTKAQAKAFFAIRPKSGAKSKDGQ